MSRTDWFRRKSWTPEIQDEFRARLKRSRTASRKAQYLRIQAYHLEHDAEPPEIEAALQLLDELLRDYPDSFELAQAHQQRGSCLRSLGRLADARQSLQAALDAERDNPGIQGSAYIDYAEIVLLTNEHTLYEEALGYLGKRVHQEPFPFIQYRSAVATAFLCERLGKLAEARAAAARALSAAAKTETPFRYHRRLGLVTDRDPDVDARLWRLAQSA